MLRSRALSLEKEDGGQQRCTRPPKSRSRAASKRPRPPSRYPDSLSLCATVSRSSLALSLSLSLSAPLSRALSLSLSALISLSLSLLIHAAAEETLARRLEVTQAALAVLI